MSSQTLPSPPSPPPIARSSIDGRQFVPTYSAANDDSLFALVEQTPDLELPITQARGFPSKPSIPAHLLAKLPAPEPTAPSRQIFELERDIVNGFFDAVRAGQDDVVSQFVSRGLVSPDVRSLVQETPLLAAVAAGRLPMISTLVALGATVNTFGKPSTPPVNYGRKTPDWERTPLQLAAQQGNLAIVKVLMEDYGADDSLIAPDGALALRLAAENGHRDIVTYLPSRRGGALLRWKAAHRREMKIIRRSIRGIYMFFRVLIWEIPKFFLFTIPNEAVWKKRHKIASWCKRLPSRIAEEVTKMPHRMKTAAKETAAFVKKIPKFIKEASIALVRFVKAWPAAVKAFLGWVGRGLATIGNSALSIATKLLSLIHTAVSAVVSFFRSITLKDVWNGLCVLARAVFVETPQAVWSFLKSFGDMAWKVLGGLFGLCGQALWGLAAIFLYILRYVPKKLGSIAAALGRLFQKAFNEVMVYFNPKRL
ncbi:hypothetical protein B0I35DRAFT_348711 [Stachybotrys elegans]|uniref:Ankyrin n=1 Tax=Stachybotrys elegans TaxID=80388 RepID=A0A8K0SXH8_9HYPO|nr:hypothetical protein B0I35DRAFT_348711 [Stachybotrys elegans]